MDMSFTHVIFYVCGFSWGSSICPTFVVRFVHSTCTINNKIKHISLMKHMIVRDDSLWPIFFLISLYSGIILGAISLMRLSLVTRKVKENKILNRKKETWNNSFLLFSITKQMKYPSFLFYSFLFNILFLSLSFSHQPNIPSSLGLSNKCNLCKYLTTQMEHSG